MENDFNILIGAGLDHNAKDQLQSDLDKIKDLEATVSHATFDQNAFNELQEDLDRLQNLTINVSDINANNSQISRQAQQTGRQIAQEVQRSVSNELRNSEGIINNFRRTLENIGMSSDNIDIVIGQIRSLGVAVSSLDQTLTTTNNRRGQRNVLSVEVEGFDSMNNAVKLTRQFNHDTGQLIKSIDGASSAAQKENTNIEHLMAQQTKRRADLKNQVRQIYQSAVDPNASRSITDDSHLSELENLYNNIIGRIDNMGSQSKAVFAEQDADVTDLIASLKILVNEYKNAENVQTSLKPDKLANAISKAESQFEALKADIDAANVSSDKLVENVNLIANAMKRLDEGEILNKADIEQVFTALLNARNELSAQKAIDASDSSIKALRVQADTLDKELDAFGGKNSGFSAWTTEINGVIVDLQTVKDLLKDVKKSSDLKVARAYAQNFKSSFIANQNTKTSKERSVATKITSLDNKLDTEQGKYSTRWIDEQQAALEKYGKVTEDTKAQLEELRQAFADMNDRSASADKRLEAEQRFKKAVNQTTVVVKEARQAWQGLATDQQRLTLANRIESFMQKNTKITKDARNELQGYISQLRNLDTELERVDMQRFATELQRVENNMRALHKLGYNLKDQFKQAAHSFTEWLSVSSAIMYGIDSIRKIPTEVKAVNSAIIELTKVSEASGGQIANYFDKAAYNAKDLGATVSDVIGATADWSRLGYNLVDSEELSRVALLYKNVGDGIDVATANEALTSTLQGFQLEASEAMSVIDKFNEVANNMPIDSAGIGEALRRSAAAFHSANTDLSESIALITSSNSVIQDPASVGTMWKTVSMRIRGATAELREAGLETDGMVESTSQLRDLVKAMTGFDIMEDDDTFKSIYDIMVGIGKEWHTLKDIEQASLLEALAGKRQGNALAAALEDVTLIEEAYKFAEESAGSALREQEEYERGIQFSLDRLSASFQEFSNHALNSDAFKGFVDSGNMAINMLDGLVQEFGTLGSIGAIGGFVASLKNVGGDKLFSLVNLPTATVFLCKVQVWTLPLMRYIKENSRYGLNRLT